MEIEVAEPARKHGISDADMIHALLNAIVEFDLDDGFIMHIGPDHAANLLEIGTIERTAIVIVHAMAARRKFLT